MNIYEISREHGRILEILNEMEGETTPELEQELEAIFNEGDNKVEAIYHVYRNFAAQLPGIVKEIDRITAIKKSLESQIKRIENMLEIYMKASMRDRIEIGTMKMILAKKTTFEYSTFPKEFIETVTTEKEKLGDFKAWAKENPETALALCGAKFIEGKTIQIK